MIAAYTVDKQHGVEIMEINHGELFMACAVQCDGNSYGGNSYWFTIGHYKKLENAKKASVKKLAMHGYEIEFKEVLSCI